MEQKFKSGDVVTLNSGGPKMTVVKYEPENSEYVTCQWFDKNQNLEERSFQQDILDEFVETLPRFGGDLSIDESYGF